MSVEDEQFVGGPETESREGTRVENASVPRHGLVTLALLLAMAVAALEQTVVSTAMPSIIAQLKGLEIFHWVFSAYLLAATVTTPLYGKLADRWGRKHILLFGLALFSLGSILSGCARSMPQLIGFRIVQGLGAGALGPIILTLIGDLYPLRERARVQGWFSGVWGVSSLAGPALGGLLTDYLSWRWVFFITVPFGLLSAVCLVLFVHERVERRPLPPIDWPGAVLLAGGTSALLIAILGGGRQSWGGGLVALAAAAGMLVLFVRRERQVEDPVLPLDLLIHPTIGPSIVGSLLMGALLFGIDTYIPLFIQGVRGGSALQAGRTITPLFLAWSISVAVAARVVVRFGLRATAWVGTALIAAGAFLLVLGAARPSASGFGFPVALVVIGLGMGPTALCYILSAQHAVTWGRRGAVTGAVIFFRTLGGAVGVGLLGAVLGAEVALRFAMSGSQHLDVASALRPETHHRLAAADLQLVQMVLGHGLRDVIFVMFVLSAFGLLCAVRLPVDSGGSPADRSPDSSGDLDDELALISTEV